MTFLHFQINNLHEVLERLQNNQFPALRKKHGYLPVVGNATTPSGMISISKICSISLEQYVTFTVTF